VKIDVETFCELVELTREKPTYICNLPLRLRMYGPITLEGQWMDEHGNRELENLNDANKLTVHIIL
jgi:hypothetical protein